MPTTREELEAKTSAVKSDLRVPSAVVSVVTALCLGICSVVIMPPVRNVLGLGAWVLLCASVVAVAVAVRWWAGRLKTSRKLHGLLCPHCGKFITKTGFRGVLTTSRCEHCNSSL